MKKEEYLEELMKDKNFESTLNISANINAILIILLKNNLTTQEEYVKLVDESKIKLQEVTLKSLSEKVKEDLEIGKKFRDLFGKGLEDLI